ncbi:MAG TPA: PQQ-binding-like beta-propeller repeat protein [Candidatus Elarobacter sp.]|jgi:outer membrane protein assembly factor BamB
MHRRILVSSAVLFALAQPALAADAPTFRGNLAHTGVYAGAGPAAFGGVKWKFQTGGSIVSSPAVAGDTAYVGSSDGFVYAVALADGAQRWKFATAARVVSSPAVTAGSVYASSYDGNVYAIDATSGKKRWHFATRGEHRFIAPHLHGALPVHEPMPDPWDFFLSSPAVSRGIVYAGSGDGNVYALDAASGRKRWAFHTGNVVHASPAVAGDTVYVGSWDGYFYALDAATGALRWKFKTGDDPDIHNHVGIQSSATVVGGVVYFGSRDAHVYALDAKTGHQKWRFATAGGAWASSSPAVSGGRVYFGEGSSGLFRALDATTGKPVFTLDTVNAPFSSPAVAGTMLYVGQSDGKVAAVDLTARKVAWTFQTGDEPAAATPAPAANDIDRPFYDNMVVRVKRLVTRAVFSSPAVAGSVVYVGSGDGYLYALR